MIDKETEEIVDLAMQDTVPFSSICFQFKLTSDEIVALMRKNLSANSYRRWKERRGLSSFRKHSEKKPSKFRTATISNGKQRTR